MLNRCGCGRAYCKPGAARCDECSRRLHYGALVAAIDAQRHGQYQDSLRMEDADRRFWSALDALAGLMIDGARVRLEHRREVNEITRDAQRDASGAFREGRAEGLAEGRGPGW